MSLWYDKKGKTYASKGSSSWVKCYTEHWANALTARLEGHCKGTAEKHRAEDILVDSGSSVAEVLDAKVDKIAGMGLSHQDYTAAEKEKLSGIAEGATPVGNPLPAIGAESFNDYGSNTANIPYAHIEGLDNNVKLKCFLIGDWNEDWLMLDSVEGIEVGMPWYIFLNTPEKQVRYTGYVEAISGNKITVTAGEMPTSWFAPSETPSYFGTFIVNGGSIGSFEITDTAGEFSCHIEGHGNEATLDAHAEGTGTKAYGYSAHAEGRKTNATGQCSHAEGYGGSALRDGAHVEGASCKANGIYSHAEGYYTETNQRFAHSEGWETKAQGDASHAEGYGTTANNYAHAEGNTTTASGEGSHAEGNHTVASGRHSHSEGSGTKAQGVRSHAEGDDTIAFGECAHAEGKGTIANGQYSHTEGYGTIANSKHQHVQGTYNVVDDNNVYAHIVGNGSASMSSNAYTLDWTGNGRFAGKVYSENSKELVTKDQVETLLASTVGVDDIASTDKPGIVQLYNGGGLQMIPVGLSGTKMLATDPATESEIEGKASFFNPIVPSNLDFAIVKGTHQEMGNEYDVSSLSINEDMSRKGTHGQFPVSYDAVKGYVDATIPEWAKQPTKPTYTAEEVGALSKHTSIPTKVSDLTNDLGYLTEQEVYSAINAAISEALGGKS